MKKAFDIAILGGGAAGIMSALSAKEHHPKLSVCIIEKNSVIGRKILICGAGRCNLTNSNIDTNRYYGANKRFI
ncbi:NAD(P)/FAD-dependent oxidoreductase, partial [Candidatus Dojkabacteria bacterium]|nr:NAD(P)/FAD-dependent oxidoreductase [Candidatus Dojkabacteria bacterium]